jgi:beta-galactosidase
MRKPPSMKPTPLRRHFAVPMILLGVSALAGCGTSGGTSGVGGATGDAAVGTGGSGTGSGGSTASGGNTGAAGTAVTGGGGTMGLGGTTGSAGTTGTAGTTGAAGAAGTQIRTISNFDDGWLFNLGDATGADQTAFNDAAWRSVRVPHDWSIEGTFDQAATTTASGGYLPAGIGWYRKHFTLPANFAGHRIFVEFDGVMANSDVYINGFHLGLRPDGYVSFRYEITAQATFGTTANVIAVRANNTPQPASRWYTGAGIYRHVRLIATNPVHVAQWATFVTTPTATTTAATVHVQTTVTNQGTSAQSVSVQAVVSDPTGTRLAPVTSAAQSIAANASVDFAVDVPVTNPRLWSTTSPSMYQATASVLIGGNAVDDDVVPFGIRTIRFDPDAGFSLNGTNLKFKGVGMHHEVGGLGAAVPLRAWQRRLAQIKAIGGNALRTSHNPFSPELLDLCDRMGIMIMDEFFDAWTAHKVAGDYGGATFNTWGTIDMTDTIKRDRNHPALMIYSLGNEIRDSLASRVTTATRLKAAKNLVDTTRPVTQALFQPSANTPADYPGGMLDVLDVFGANYHVTDVVAAIAIAPHHPGLVTEDISSSTGINNWATVTATPALTGDFIWTAFDYLGEAAADGGFPVVGSSTGLMDRMGTHKPAADSFQRIWSTSPVVAVPTGTAATKIVLTADHPTLLVDPGDVTYVKATVADATNRLVPTAGNAVTFSLTGPGTIIAVDSGSVMAESFRGTVRKAFNGLAFAIIQATGPGTITVTASAAGLTTGTATVQGTAGTFVPCAGTCD